MIMLYNASFPPIECHLRTGMLMKHSSALHHARFIPDGPCSLPHVHAVRS